jgi:hypothetical protein
VAVLNAEDVRGKVVPFSRAASVPIVAPAPDERTLELVRRLRVLWRNSQLSRRDDFDRACLLIAGDETTTVERYAAAFFEGAQIFAHRRLKFFNAKSAAVSDDEMWLARILLSLHKGDHTSARYLIALRIAPTGQRRLMFLLQRLALHVCNQEVPRQP